MLLFQHKYGVLDLSKTAVMGIVNVTPDSFSDGGRCLDPVNAVAHAQRLQAEGAAILDIGAQSTRPGYTPLSDADEWVRLSPVLDALHGQVAVPLSVDTFSPFVAERALENGVAILNDISGSKDNGFPSLAAAHGAGLIMMARGAASPFDVRRQFEAMLTLADDACLPLSQVCLDIGIGFHQSREVEFAILRILPRLIDGLPPVPILCGASRKRLIAYAAGDCPPSDRLGGTVALHTVAQLGGARILRVHDVAAAVQAAAVTDTFTQQQKEL